MLILLLSWFILGKFEKVLYNFVFIGELFISGLITKGVLMSGLLTGSGLGLLILFKENDNKKENLSILLTIYFIGVIIGFILDLFL